MRVPLVLALLAVMTAAIPARSTAAPTRASLPRAGVLVPGKTLGGIALGDTRADVLARWGSDFRVCEGCSLPTLFYTYDDEDATQQGLGAGVVFRGGRVVAVFTLGMPTGWHTADGVALGQMLPKVGDRYDGLRWKTCIGYIAMSMRPSSDAVTSIYTDGDTVYGFALTHRSVPVCQ